MRDALAIAAAVILALTSAAIPMGPVGAQEGAEFVYLARTGEVLVGPLDAAADHQGSCQTDAIGGYILTGQDPKERVGALGDNPPCPKEDHLDGWSSTLAFGFPNPNGVITGVTCAVLQSETGLLTFCCSWLNGAWTQWCHAPDFNWPPTATSFTFECFSKFVASLEEGNPHKGPSLGQWSCYVSHT